MHFVIIELVVCLLRTSMTSKSLSLPERNTSTLLFFINGLRVCSKCGSPLLAPDEYIALSPTTTTQSKIFTYVSNAVFKSFQCNSVMFAYTKSSDNTYVSMNTNPIDTSALVKAPLAPVFIYLHSSTTKFK